VGKGFRCIKCDAKLTNRNKDDWCKVPGCGDENHNAWQLFNYKASTRWAQLWDNRQIEMDMGAEVFDNLRNGWRTHILIEGGGTVACFECGKFGANSKNCFGIFRRSWTHEPCKGHKTIGKALGSLIASGTFDLALNRKLNESKGRGAERKRIHESLHLAGVTVPFF